jgi:thiol-disulfide isomerase/thioredoxin/outer membrane lipoprotein-sorting protein
MRLTVIAALALSSLCAQQFPDGETLNEQAAAAVKRLHSLQYKEEMTTETAFGDQNLKMTTESSRAVLNPGKMRVESKVQGLTMLIVSDGESTWTYSSMNNEYTRKSAALGPQGVMDAMGMGAMMPSLADVHLTPKTTGEESVVIDGQKHDCWVVHTDIGAMVLPAAAKGAKISDGTMTSWIDKKLGITVQSDISMKVAIPGGISTQTHVKTVMKDIEIDAPIADSIFTFTPPQGAKEVEKLSLFGAMGATPDLAGKAAPDFTVQTVDGKPYSLSALKGKPVLLDFWATWCGPCRKAMPSVEQISQDYKDQGLVVLGVNAGEDRDTVREFLKKTPMAYPAVLGGESGILKNYQVTAYPTFVLIGSDGKIAAYEIGFNSQEMLRAMLQQAGLKAK